MPMSKDQVIQTVLKSEDLPTLPAVASKLLIITGQEETTLTDIANLVSQDMALSAKILKVANSAFYSFPQQISSINQAVSILGTNAVRSLVLSFSFLSMRTRGDCSKFDFKRFWEQSLAGAVATKLILDQVPGADTEEAFIAALLHNLGQLVLASTLPELYEQVLTRLEEDKDADETEVEKKIIGEEHSVIGHAVAQHWGFPESLLLPIRYHHQPDAYTGKNTTIAQCLRAIYLADILTGILFSDEPEEFHKTFRSEAKKQLGLKVLAINKVLKEVHKQVNQTAEYFGLSIKPTKSVEEILQEANLKLSILNMSYEEMNRELIRATMKLEKTTKELAQKNKLLENLANIDGLTEIHNHRYFQNFLDKEINRAIRNEGAVSILLIDIDNFKKFNDTYGHQTGDFILKELCRICKEQIREYDLMARYGGEEFIFVLPETGPEDARTVAEKIRKTVEEYTFDDGNNTYKVTISVGVASAHPSGRDFKKNEFIGLADEALYEAKAKGRNRVEMYKPGKKRKWFNF